MKRIIYFDWHESATEFYRMAPLTYIQNADFITERSTIRDISWASINHAYAIVIARPSSDQSLKLIKLAKDMGIKVIVDFDDDCLHIDQYNPMYQIYIDQKKNVIESLALADEVWASTKAIKQSFRLFNSNIHVIPNAHNDYIFKVEDKKEFSYNKTAMWRGGYSHEGDMYDIKTPETIIEMVNNNTDWTFQFLGQRFLYLEKRCGDNYVSVNGASTVQFYKMMHDINPSVFFYPLSDTLFNKSKSNCSWLEATYSGAAYFGNKKLPEYIDGTILPIEEINDFLNGDSYILELYNMASWEYISDNLLLSKVNELRTERLLAI